MKEKYAELIRNMVNQLLNNIIFNDLKISINESNIHNEDQPINDYEMIKRKE